MGYSGNNRTATTTMKETTMKLTRTAAAVLSTTAAVLTIAACSPDPQPVTATTSSTIADAGVEPAAEETTAPTTDQRFLDYMDSEGVQYSSEGAILDLAHKVCGGFDAGLTFFNEVTAITDSGFYSASQAGTIIGSSIAAYCPEHANKVH